MKIKQFLAKCYIGFLKLLPIKKNRIYFVSNFGSRVACNPKAFFYYLYNNHNKEFDFYYAVNDKSSANMPKGVKTAKYRSLKDLYYLYTSKYIVNNFRFHQYFKKRKKQYYIQTWHGGPIPQKKIEQDAIEDLSQNYIRNAINDSNNMDLLLTGSKSLQKIFSKCFWYNGEVACFGTPRYDQFFKDNTQKIAEIKQSLNINKDAKVVLYAPTFRYKAKMQDIMLNDEEVLKIFKNYFKQDVVLLYRFHPNQESEIKDVVFKNSNVLNLTTYPDPIDLELIADCLITDFSSILADFYVLKKPCLIFARDFDNYLKNERQMYIDYDKYPYPIFKTEKEIANYLKNNDILNQPTQDKEFEKLIGLTEVGTACESLYNKIKQVK